LTKPQVSYLYIIKTKEEKRSTRCRKGTGRILTGWTRDEANAERGGGCKLFAVLPNIVRKTNRGKWFRIKGRRSYARLVLGIMTYAEKEKLGSVEEVVR